MSLIVAGHALIALPLSIVAILGVLNAQQLAEQSKRLLEGGVQVIERSQQLQEDMVAMERSARQYQVLADPALRQVFEQYHAGVGGLLNELERLQSYAGGDWKLRSAREDLNLVRSVLRDHPPGSAEIESTLTVFDRLHPQAAALTAEARQFVAREAAAIEMSAASNNEKLLLLATVMLPLSAAVALILAVYVTRPLQVIDRAIRNLGANKFDERFAAGGPVEIRQLAQQLDWLRERLRTVEQDKNRFLRQMAHELKTPLASVREGSDLLVEGILGPLSAKQQEVATILSNNSFELQVLIENLLDYEEWREKTGKLDRTRFPLKPLVEHCVKRYRLIFASQQIQLAGRCRDVEVYADRTRLRMTLDNLISNALKFSPKNGTVTVIADVADSDGANAHDKNTQRLIVEVADEGPGIPHAERGKIFEPFYQGGPPLGRHVEGTGIGLTVVRDCVEAHGGSIDIVDGEYRGAHFRIELPLPTNAG